MREILILVLFSFFSKSRNKCLWFCIVVLPFRQTRDSFLWTSEDSRTEIPHHRVPTCLLCRWKLRRSEREDEVKFKLDHFLNLCQHKINSLMIHTKFWNLKLHFGLLCWTSIICRQFATTIPRKFGVRYNPYTLSVEVLDNMRQISYFATDLKTEMGRLEDSLKKLSRLPKPSS